MSAAVQGVVTAHHPVSECQDLNSLLGVVLSGHTPDCDVQLSNAPLGPSPAVLQSVIPPTQTPDAQGQQKANTPLGQATVVLTHPAVRDDEDVSEPMSGAVEAAPLEGIAAIPGGGISPATDAEMATPTTAQHAATSVLRQKGPFRGVIHTSAFAESKGGDNNSTMYVPGYICAICAC